MRTVKSMVHDPEGSSVDSAVCSPGETRVSSAQVRTAASSVQ